MDVVFHCKAPRAVAYVPYKCSIFSSPMRCFVVCAANLHILHAEESAAGCTRARHLTAGNALLCKSDTTFFCLVQPVCWVPDLESSAATYIPSL